MKMHQMMTQMALCALSIFSSAALADGWRFLLTDVRYVDNYSNGGIVAQGSLNAKYIENATVVQEYQLSSNTVTIFGTAANMECASHLATAFVNKKSFLVQTTEEFQVFSPTGQGLTLHAKDVLGCGLRN